MRSPVAPYRLLVHQPKAYVAKQECQARGGGPVPFGLWVLPRRG